MLPNFYKSLSEEGISADGWEICPICEQLPLVWIFDNGSFAKCCCNGMYDAAAAKGMSIFDYSINHNGNMTDFNHNDLRDNWNEVAVNRKELNNVEG